MKEMLQVKEEDITSGTSLVVKWLRICLSMQGIQVRFPGPGGIQMVQDNQACVPQLASPRSGACTLQSLCSATGEATAGRSLHTATREYSPLTAAGESHAQRRSSTAKNKHMKSGFTIKKKHNLGGGDH